MDLSKCHPGKLCKRNHSWNDSQQSLRNNSGQCIECLREKRKRFEQERTHIYIKTDLYKLIVQRAQKENISIAKWIEYTLDEKIKEVQDVDNV